VASPAKGWASYTVYRPYSSVESVDRTQPIYFPSPSEIFGRVYMGAAVLPFIPTSAYSTLRCVGDLFGMRSTSPVGVCISTTCTIPRLIPRPQRTSEHAGFHLNLVVEYQVYHRGGMDRWWTQGQ
jgi:hypothetical protein